MNDVVIIARDIAGDAAQKAATKVNPSEDQLNQIDRPAEDNTWHDVPDLSKDNLKQQFNERKPFSKADAKNAADQSLNTAQQPDGSVDTHAGASQGINHLQSQASANIDDETKDKARNKKDEYRDRSNQYLKEKFPEERRDQAIWRLKKMVAEVQGHQDCKSLDMLNL